MSSSSFTPPSWCAAPASLETDPPELAATLQWHLTEIKQGVQVAQHTLHTRAATVLGRAADQVDIVLQHESCSRRHAVLWFDGTTGTPWFRDFQSTHKTRVNKKTLPPQACRQFSPSENNNNAKGSRGVILYPGDVLQFGASTRIFCLEGPSQYERGRPAVRSIVKQRPAQLPVNSNSNDDDTHSSPPIFEELDETQIPRAHAKLYEQVRALLYKRSQATLESNRILSKGRANLSQGQELQLERLQERIEDLETSIDEKKGTLMKALFPLHHGGGGGRQKTSSIDMLDDDDLEQEVEDRTRGDDHNDNTNESVETLDSLLAQRRDLRVEQAPVEQQLARATTQAAKLQTRIDFLNAQGETEEAFFVQNDASVYQEQIRKYQVQLANIQKKFVETEQLLNVIDPKGAWKRQEENEQEASKQEHSQKQSTTMAPPPRILPPPVAGTNNNSHLPPDQFVLPAPPANKKRDSEAIATPTSDAFSMPAAKLPAPSATTNSSSETSFSLPAPKRPKRIIGPAAMPPPNFNSQDTTKKDDLTTPNDSVKPKAHSLANNESSLPAELQSVDFSQRIQWSKYAPYNPDCSLPIHDASSPPVFTKSSPALCCQINGLSGRARATTIHLTPQPGQRNHPARPIPTPMFMPVGTKGCLKGIDITELTTDPALSCPIILANTYHMAIQPGTELVDSLGGLHHFQGLSKLSGTPNESPKSRPSQSYNLLTDSGGFQMVSLVKLSQVTEEGVSFQNPFSQPKPFSKTKFDANDNDTTNCTNGKNTSSSDSKNEKDVDMLLLRPEDSIRHQNNIGANIIMALDDVVSSVEVNDARFRVATHRTLRWYDRCVKAHAKSSTQNLFPIVQGGLDTAVGGLREQCLAGFRRRDEEEHYIIPGYAIGGLAGGEDKDDFWRVVDQCCKALPDDKPRYLMGVGYPLDLVVCSALGVDLYDCVYPTRTARFGVALVPGKAPGTLRLKARECAMSPNVIQSGCPCLACRDGITRGRLHSLLKADNPLAVELITQHNIAYMMSLAKNMRHAVLKDRYGEFARSFILEQYPGKEAGGEDCPGWVVDAMHAAGIPLKD